jgi:hypothetical protein
MMQNKPLKLPDLPLEGAIKIEGPGNPITLDAPLAPPSNQRI